jgi:predicted nucleic acid-binding protein
VATFTLDTNCMVAAVCTWHEHHAAASGEIEARLKRGERLAVAAPALVETYAVLTRLPPPHRLAPSDAWQLIDANFAGDGQIVALRAPAYRRLLRRLAKEGVAGGRTYDAVMGECARQSGADALLTFNRRHFDPAPDGVAVVEPSLTR